MADGLFNFCDLTCRFAEIPEDSGSMGPEAAATFVALYCKRKKSLVHKNMACSKKVAKEGPKAGEYRAPRLPAAVRLFLTFCCFPR